MDYKKRKEGNVGSPVRQPSLAHADVYKHGHTQCLFHGTCCTPGGQAPLCPLHYCFSYFFFNNLHIFKFIYKEKQWQSAYKVIRWYKCLVRMLLCLALTNKRMLALFTSCSVTRLHNVVRFGHSPRSVASGNWFLFYVVVRHYYMQVPFTLYEVRIGIQRIQ